LGAQQKLFIAESGFGSSTIVFFVAQTELRNQQEYFVAEF
jgi:hypothetical protein